jgi:thiol:disulfide interchange protein DsbD
MDSVKHIFGFLLVGMAIYFLLPLIPKSLSGWLLPVYGILMGVYLILFERKANNIKGFYLFKIAFSVLIIALSVYAIWPVEKLSPDWIKFSHQQYNDAITTNEKILIDVSADWCIPCKELDHITFTDERVIEALSDFKSFKVDFTRSNSEENEIIREKFDIRGVPTLIFFDTNGSEVRRLTGFVDADEFLKILSNIN